MNLASILVRAARLHGRRSAVSCRGRSFTYGEFHGRAARLAAILREEGIGPGTALAMLHRNCHHFLEAYFAAASLGAVLVPLNHRLLDHEIAWILEDSLASALIAEPALADVASRALDRAPGGPRRLLLSHGEGEDSLERRAFGLNVQPPLECPVGEGDPAQLYYTSGTTGTPKGVILTHLNGTSHALAAIAELGLSERDVWLHAAPMFHLADAWATWAVTWAGGRHVLLPEFDPEAVFDTIAAEQVTLTNLIPTMLVMLVHHPRADAKKLISMRRILSGGAPMALELLKRVEALFPCEYVQTYGLTETSPYLTVSLLTEDLKRRPPEERQRFRATTGRPMIGVDLRVVDAAGVEVPRDGAAVGEIVVRGPSVTPGYHNRPEEWALAFREGWFHTGDLAQVGPEGYLMIVDRIKDVINTGGEQVYSTEVENALYAHPAVKEAAVVGVPHDVWGEAVKAVVVLKEGQETGAEALIAHCKQRLAPFKVPRSMDFMDALPRTGSGKIDKKSLREPYWQGEDKRVH